MKVVFLNVWGEEMRDELAPYLKAQAADTDIFCLQEARDGMRAACAAVFGNFQEIACYKFISDNEYFSQSIYLKRGVQIVSSGTLFAEDVAYGIANYVQLRQGSKTVYICNAHGRPNPGDKLDTPYRIGFSEALIDHFNGIDATVLIGGDFNLEPTTKGVRIFEERGYRDLVKQYGITTTRNHFAWDLYPGEEQYYSDYVFINNKVKLQDFTVQDNEVSDHLPLVVEFEP